MAVGGPGGRDGLPQACDSSYSGWVCRYILQLFPYIGCAFAGLLGVLLVRQHRYRTHHNLQDGVG